MKKKLNHTQTFFQSASPSLFSKKYLSKKQAKLVLLDQAMSLRVSYEELDFLRCLINESVDSTWASERPMSEVTDQSFPFSQPEIKELLVSLVKKKFISIDTHLHNFYRIYLSGLYKRLQPLLPQEYIDMEEFL